MLIKNLHIVKKLSKSYSFCKILLILACFFLFVQHAKSQVNAKIAFDSTAILIGDQINFHIVVEQPRNAKVSFPVFTDTINKNIEIISTTPADTAFLNPQLIKIHKKYLITSFDSGDYKIDFLKFPVHYAGAHDTAYSNATMLYVRALRLQDANSIADIKDVIKIPVTLKEVLPYIFFGVLAWVVIALIVYIVLYWNHKKSIFGLLEKPADPAHVVAFRELEKLRGEKLWQQGHYKLYYSRLTDILRAYIENRIRIPAMESTSDEIIDDLKDNPLVDSKLMADLKEMLSLADLVKFAKAEPLPEENENAWQFTNDFVVKTFKDPAVEEAGQVENAEEKKDI